MTWFLQGLFWLLERFLLLLFSCGFASGRYAASQGFSSGLAPSLLFSLPVFTSGSKSAQFSTIIPINLLKFNRQVAHLGRWR